MKKSSFTFFGRLVLITFLLLFFRPDLRSQITILGAPLNEEFVSPAFMMNCIIQNHGFDCIAILSAFIEDTETGEKLLTVKSSEMQIKKGVNNIVGNNLSLRESRYSNSKVGEFIRLFNKLPTGTYNYCIHIEVISGESYEDELCTSLEKIYDDYLSLTYPSDKDTIHTFYPLLSWTSSFPIEAEVGKRKFRMIVTEKKEDEGAASAISSNPPILFIENLMLYNYPYPIDAMKLLPGKSYAWQVQSYMDGKILDVSECWYFTIWEEKVPEDIKYAELKKIVGAEYYHLNDGKLFIAFKERYAGEVTMTSGRIINPENEEVQTVMLGDISEESKNDRTTEEASIRISGANLYLLDVSNLGLKSGIYQLEMENYKGEIYKLKFLSE